jgi:hypothetical protein
MNKRIAVMALAGLSMTGGIAAANALPPGPYTNGAFICHNNGDGTYTLDFASVHGLAQNGGGHRGHEGDIFLGSEIPVGIPGCVLPGTETSAPAVPVPAVPVPAVPVPAGQPRNQGYNVDGGVSAEPARETFHWAPAALVLPAAALVFWWGQQRRRRMVEP